MKVELKFNEKKISLLSNLFYFTCVYYDDRNINLNTRNYV